jgi:tetratricopeptide repeat protein/putative zinc finger protein
MTVHVDFGTLAELADGVLPPGDAARARAHLGECRSCMAAYADAVRYRAAWLTDPDGFAADDQIRRWAESHGREPLPPSRSSNWARVAVRVLPAAAATVLVAWLAASPFAGRAPSLDFELSPAVRDAAERSSERGLVLPGAVAGADRIRPELRSGRPMISPGLDREIRDAIQEYEHGAPSPDAGARVVAALLAAGEIDAARDYAKECLKRSANHVPLLVFASDAYYRSNDLAGAEELLRNAVRHAPDDPLVALDLALVLEQAGREQEARSLLMRVTKSRVSPLATRAARYLSRSGRCSVSPADP